MMTRVELLYWLGSLGLDHEIVQPMLNRIGSDEQGKRIQKRKKKRKAEKGSKVRAWQVYEKLGRLQLFFRLYRKHQKWSF
jgi:hypothetical protein